MTDRNSEIIRIRTENANGDSQDQYSDFNRAPITSRYDSRGALKPLFDDYLNQTPSSYSMLKNDPIRFLNLILTKLKLIPATYKITESHLHDYDIPIDVFNENLSKMPRVLTKLTQAAESSISLIRSVLDELNNDDGPLIPNTELSGDINQLTFVDSVSIKVMIKLNDVISSKKDPLLSVVNYSIRQTSNSNKAITSEVTDLFVKDSRISFFLLAYIDILIGWILASAVKSHPSSDVLFDYGVDFRLSGVRPIPTYWLNRTTTSGICIGKFINNNNYLQFRNSVHLFSYHLPNSLRKAIYFNLFNDSKGELNDFYDACDEHETSKSMKTIDMLDFYVPIYDLMYSSIRLSHKIKAYALESDNREEFANCGTVGLEAQESITDENVNQLMGENVDLNVVMIEASNLADFYDRKYGGYTTSYQNIYSRIVKQSQKLIKEGKISNSYLNESEGLSDETADYSDNLSNATINRVDRNHTSDSAIAVDSLLPESEVKSDGNGSESSLEIPSFSSDGVSELIDRLVDYNFIDVKRSYINVWSGFIYEVYDLAEASGYDPRVIEDYLHDYDSEAVRRILTVFKSSPVKAYSVNGRLVDLLRLYHVAVYAPSRSEVLKLIVSPEHDPATDEDFREFLKFYLIVNTGLGDARVFMNKLSDSMFGGALAGDYSVGKGSRLYCTIDDPSPLNVVFDCDGFEWLDISKLEGFLSLMEDNPDWGEFPEGYVRETISMEPSK